MELVTKDSCDLKFMTVASHMSCRVSVVVTHVRGGTAFQKHLDGARVAKGGRAEEGLNEGRGEGGEKGEERVGRGGDGKGWDAEQEAGDTWW